MSNERCAGCERKVPVAGGIANLWSFDGRHTAGMTLEFEDDTEHFLCFDCIDELPDDPNAEDVEGLPERPSDEPIGDGTHEDSGVGYVLPAVVGGAILGTAVALAVGQDVEPLLVTGAALGVGVALLAEKLTGE